MVFSENIREGDVFAVPASDPAHTSEYVVFKMVALKPGNRQYLQRACHLSVDVPWLVIFVISSLLFLFHSS